MASGDYDLAASCRLRTRWSEVLMTINLDECEQRALAVLRYYDPKASLIPDPTLPRDEDLASDVLALVAEVREWRAKHDRIEALRAILQKSPIVCGESLSPGDPNTKFCPRLSTWVEDDYEQQYYYCEEHARIRRDYLYAQNRSRIQEAAWASEVRALEEAADREAWEK